MQRAREREREREKERRERERERGRRERERERERERVGSFLVPQAEVTTAMSFYRPAYVSRSSSYGGAEADKPSDYDTVGFKNPMRTSMYQSVYSHPGKLPQVRMTGLWGTNLLHY